MHLGTAALYPPSESLSSEHTSLRTSAGPDDVAPHISQTIARSLPCPRRTHAQLRPPGPDVRGCFARTSRWAGSESFALPLPFGQDDPDLLAP